MSAVFSTVALVTPETTTGRRELTANCISMLQTQFDTYFIILMEIAETGKQQKESSHINVFKVAIKVT